MYFDSSKKTSKKDNVLREVAMDCRKLKDAAPELKADREVVLAAVKQDGFGLKYAAPELKADREVVLAAVKQYGSALEYAAPELKADRELVLAAVKQDGLALMFAASELKADREVVLAALKQNGFALEYAAPELKADRELVLAAVKQDGRALKYAASELKSDRELVLAAVKQNGYALKYAAPELKADREVVLAAVKQNGLALQYAASELKSDREVVLAAVKQNGFALIYAAPELKSDRELVLAALKQNGYALEYAASELKADREVVLAAVKQNGYALKYAAPELKADREVVLAALKQNRFTVPVVLKHYGFALKYAASELKSDREFVLAAVKQNGFALIYAAPELKSDRELVLAAVKQNGFALQYAAPELKADREVVLAAVKRHGSALEYAAPEVRNDKEVVAAAVHSNEDAIMFASASLRKEYQENGRLISTSNQDDQIKNDDASYNTQRDSSTEDLAVDVDNLKVSMSNDELRQLLRSNKIFLTEEQQNVLVDTARLHQIAQARQHNENALFKENAGLRQYRDYIVSKLEALHTAVYTVDSGIIKHDRQSYGAMAAKCVHQRSFDVLESIPFVKSVAGVLKDVLELAIEAVDYEYLKEKLLRLKKMGATHDIAKLAINEVAFHLAMYRKSSDEEPLVLAKKDVVTIVKAITEKEVLTDVKPANICEIVITILQSVDSNMAVPTDDTILSVAAASCSRLQPTLDLTPARPSGQGALLDPDQPDHSTTQSTDEKTHRVSVSPHCSITPPLPPSSSATAMTAINQNDLLDKVQQLEVQLAAEKEAREKMQKKFEHSQLQKTGPPLEDIAIPSGGGQMQLQKQSKAKTAAMATTSSTDSQVSTQLAENTHQIGLLTLTIAQLAERNEALEKQLAEQQQNKAREAGEGGRLINFSLISNLFGKGHTSR